MTGRPILLRPTRGEGARAQGPAAASWVALALAAAAALASAPDAQEASVEVFNTIPGPFFTLTDNRTVVDWLVSVRATPEAFPPRGSWREVFEVEIDFVEDGLDLDRAVVGRLARVAPSGRTVLSSTTARVDASDRATMVLVDEQGSTPCIEGVCEKQYVVRFVLLGFGDLRTQWFLKAGIDWLDDALEVPPEASVSLRIRLL